LLKLLLGLYAPTKGDVLIDGTPLSDYDAASWHKHIALLGQEYTNFYFATIRENVAFGNVDTETDETHVKRAISEAEFASVVESLEYGLDTYISRWMALDNDDGTAVELSGGQYQRLALARNFYRDAPFVILDEPTSAIDALAESKIFKRLFSSDKTIVTISHRLSTIEKADIVYMLKDGKLVESGTAAELIAARGEFYHMFESQI
jgi:ATP-binding cassette subfamily B protein/ATP-binding cassette subfamily C protein